MGASVVIGAIGLAISAVGTVQQMQAADKAEKRAEEQAAAQRAQIAEQERQAELRANLEKKQAQRAARIRAAGIVQAAGGAQVGGSVVEAPLFSLETSLASNLTQIEQGIATQRTQFELAEQQVGIGEQAAISEANASYWRSLYGFGGDVIGFLQNVDFGGTDTTTVAQGSPTGAQDFDALNPVLPTTQE